MSRALVTGASSGIGASFARRLAADGRDLVLVARRGERLERAAEELGGEHGIAVDAVVADLTDPSDRRRVEKILAGDPPFDLFVNNAGFGRYGRFDEVEPRAIEAMIELNVLAVATLARAALPGMVARDRGAIVNVASLLAFTSSIPPSPLPLRATYAATKAFVIALSEMLANELAETGVKVQALCPGIVRTEFHSIADPGRSGPPRFEPMEPDEVVEASLAGLELDEVLCLPGLQDPGLLGGAAEAQRAVFGAAAPGPRATRYAR